VAGDTVLLRDASGREHRVVVSADDTFVVDGITMQIHAAADGSLHVRGPRHVMVWAVASGDTRWVFVDGRIFTFEVAHSARRRTAASHDGPLTAPMPATVRKIVVRPGDTVRRGDILIVLEAMKMELPVRATADGVIKVLNCREGDMVKPGEELVEMGVTC
jgi:acetyl/propionyl-CoA carboxylase alpha subunit